ncbi:MAG: DNA repair protein RecO [Acidobacteria bacterium]|nr:MAG: DNA repair protein RecO [Acidobacteriota bacterium]
MFPIRHAKLQGCGKLSMPFHQSDSIILKTYPLGEADRIVAFFSRDHGKLRGVANGARKMKNRFGASLEPLAHSRIQFLEKENRDLVRIQSADLLDSPMKLFQDYDRAVCAGHLIELVDRFLPEHEPQDAVFRLVRITSRALEQGCPIDFAACYFEVWMLRLAGVFPDLFTCSACARRLEAGDARFLAPGLQAVICSHCQHGNATSILVEVVELVRWTLQNPLDGSGCGGDRAVRNLHELNDYWIRHYSER